MPTTDQLKLFLENTQEFEPKQNYCLKQFTTYKIGGPGEIVIVVKDSQQLQKVIGAAQKFEIGYQILGAGSDVLISDKGLRGLTVINKSKNIQVLESFEGQIPKIPPIHQEAGQDFYSFKDIDFLEQGQRVLVDFESGVNLAVAISFTLKNNLMGLQWFSGIPSTMGGALYNNIHGGSHHLSDYFYSAKVLTAKSQVVELGFKDFSFGYDKSILRQDQGLTVLSLKLALIRARDLEDIATAKNTAKEWLLRKKRQPKNSCGCVFKNISTQDQQRLKLPTPSTGYFIDKVLGLGGRRLGGAKIAPGHANFIINEDQATATDVWKLAKLIKTQAQQKYNLDLEFEINLLGDFGHS